MFGEADVVASSRVTHNVSTLSTSDYSSQLKRLPAMPKRIRDFDQDNEDASFSEDGGSGDEPSTSSRKKGSSVSISVVFQFSSY